MLDAYSSRITLTLSRDYLVVRGHFSRSAQFLSCIMQIYGHAIWNIVCFYCMRYIQVFDSQVFKLDALGSCFALWHFYHPLVRWLFHVTILELDTGLCASVELSNILGHIEAIELLACACRLLPEVDACGLNSQACQLIEHTNHINVATQFCDSMKNVLTNQKNNLSMQRALRSQTHQHK